MYSANITEFLLCSFKIFFVLKRKMYIIHVCGTFASQLTSFRNGKKCHFTFERPVKWRNPIFLITDCCFC